MPPTRAHRAIGSTIAIPLGKGTIRLTISSRADSVRVSLRTRDPGEVKIRQATAAAYLETIWQAMRRLAPVTLTHKQATALAGEMYRAWADEGRQQTLAIQWTGQDWVPASVTPDEDKAYFKSAIANLDTLASGDEPGALEKPLGPLVDRLLLAKGIASVDEGTRSILLQAFHLALRDAFKLRERNAEGDYLI